MKPQTSSPKFSAGKILWAVLVLLILAAVGFYFYSRSHTTNTAPNTVENSPSSDTAAIHTNNTPVTDTEPLPVKIPDSQFIAATQNPEGKVLATGDINGDGYEDAVVEDTACGASCSTKLDIVFGDSAGHAMLFNPGNDENFAPSYLGDTATQSEITNVSIKNGVISLTGNGLGCSDLASEKFCSQEEWNTVKTIEYRFENNAVVQISTD